MSLRFDLFFAFTNSIAEHFQYFTIRDGDIHHVFLNLNHGSSVHVDDRSIGLRLAPLVKKCRHVLALTPRHTSAMELVEIAFNCT